MEKSKLGGTKGKGLKEGMKLWREQPGKKTNVVELVDEEVEVLQPHRQQ